MPSIRRSWPSRPVRPSTASMRIPGGSGAGSGRGLDTPEFQQEMKKEQQQIQKQMQDLRRDLESLQLHQID